MRNGGEGSAVPPLCICLVCYSVNAPPCLTRVCRRSVHASTVVLDSNSAACTELMKNVGVTLTPYRTHTEGTTLGQHSTAVTSVSPQISALRPSRILLPLY